jgi:agmatinase
MGARPPSFADANSLAESAEFSILGVPFDATSSFRSGSRAAPNAMRDASWNFETYLMEHDVDLTDIAIHDCGNLEDFARPEDMLEAVKESVAGILRNRSFPIVMGGEHSLTPAVVSALKEAGAGGPDRFGVIVLDAHMDFRDQYLNMPNSHACTSRRTSDVVGPESIVPIGVRSVSREEMEEVQKDMCGRFRFVTADEVRRDGMAASVKRAAGLIGKDRIYLSLDIDCLDPAYAPGTGTPEPFGLTALDVREAIGILAPRLVGFDIVEIAPNYDSGNTAALGARLVREVIAAVHASRRAGEPENR